jgi:hypothetical protein
MNALATLTTPPKASAPISVTSPSPLLIDLPQWIQDCLDRVDMSQSVDSDCLICQAFKFA